jgi:hypothetical protein
VLAFVVIENQEVINARKANLFAMADSSSQCNLFSRRKLIGENYQPSNHILGTQHNYDD